MKAALMLRAAVVQSQLPLNLRFRFFLDIPQAYHDITSIHNSNL